MGRGGNRVAIVGLPSRPARDDSQESAPLRKDRRRHAICARVVAKCGKTKASLRQNFLAKAAQMWSRCVLYGRQVDP